MARLQSVAGRESESVDDISRGRETAEMVKMVDDERDAASAERHSVAAGASAGMKLGIVRLGRAGGKVRHAATWS